MQQDLDHLKKKAVLYATLENPGKYDRRGSLFSVHDPLISTIPWLKAHDTSYCKYHSPFQKHTTVLSNLGLNLLPPCNAHAPCAHHLNHLGLIEKASPRDKNSMPEMLIHRILHSFIETAALSNATAFYVLDFFSGWGSFKAAIKTFGQSNAYKEMSDNIINSKRTRFTRLDFILRSNSIVTCTEFDCTRYRIGTKQCLKRGRWEDSAVLTDPQHVTDYTTTPFQIETIVCDLIRNEDLPQGEKIAILIHASPPCKTYSKSGLHYHRPAHGALSPLASQHDSLVTDVLNELERLLA